MVLRCGPLAPRQAALDTLDGVYAVDVALGPCPVHDSVDPLFHPHGGLGHVEPDQFQCAQKGALIQVFTAC